MKALNTAIAFSIISFLRASNTSAATSCFLPSGEPAIDPPCDSHAPVSMCCANPAECLSNGLCLNPKYDPYPGANISYARGTCTDDQWGSSICPQFCLANPDSVTNASAVNFRTHGVKVWECGGDRGYSSPASYCCESMGEGARCCSTTSALFELSAATVGNPSDSTSASESSSSSPLASNTPSISTSGTPLSSSSLLVTAPSTILATPDLHSLTSSLTASVLPSSNDKGPLRSTTTVTPDPPSLTSYLTASALPSSNGKPPLGSVIGGVLGGAALLCVTIGGLWFWSNKHRTPKQTGGHPEWSKPELPANNRVPSPLHPKCIHGSHGGTQELPLPGLYELAGDDGAYEVSARHEL